MKQADTQADSAMTPQLPHSLNLPYLELLYQNYLSNPAATGSEWSEFFAEVSLNGAVSENSRKVDSHAHQFADAELQVKAARLIESYRSRGHCIASIDPLGSTRLEPADIQPQYFGLDLGAHGELRFAGALLDGAASLSLREIVNRLKAIYCGSIGFEFMHIADAKIRQWIIARVEGNDTGAGLSRDEKLRLLERLTAATSFDEFIRSHFIGAKSFSLEGSETLVPLLELIIEGAARGGMREIVFAMAHRGRLNVLANVIGKSAADIFREFADTEPTAFIGRGDVKYHLGHSSDRMLADGAKIHLSLCFNPSHIGFIEPVALGRMRAKQDRCGDRLGEFGLTVLIHGDAGFIGEGVTQESLNLSRLEGYSVGGALHIICNNQIGFTTLPTQGRSTCYASDVAKMLDVPIFHVNGEDLDAVARCARLALAFRAAFKRDVVIDLYGYRRLGHNETDEPRFTQPSLYHRISKHQPVRELYRERLIAEGVATLAQAQEFDKRALSHLDEQLKRAQETPAPPLAELPQGIWAGYAPGSGDAEPVVTAVARDQLARLIEAQCRLPEGFHPHPKIAQLVANRRAMARGERPLDWSTAEALAFASLAVQGVRVRLSGQDSARGTFSQRHAVLHDVENGKQYTPLQHVAADQAAVDIVNSPLSEAGVLGFDYGYSLDCPEGLVLWEAQFGDFCNAAQVIIDQFIASAETKWRRLSGLVLLLPHGLEGMGPEHSSARLERFLQLAANNNMRVVVPSTPGQYFHCLRRQVLSRRRTPLVIMTPKSLLRDSRASASLDDCAQGNFHPFVGALHKPNEIGRILLTSGKLSYELEQRRALDKRADIAIFRIEELYPLPLAQLEATLQPLRAGIKTLWVQEEPINMGAWRYLRATLGSDLFGRLPLSVLARPESPSPATGSAASHKLEQAQLIDAAFE
jgi:2-oxoglutarate dehydrogenase E1 component